MSLCVKSKQKILVTSSVQKIEEIFSISANLQSHKLAFRLPQSVNHVTELKAGLNGFTDLSLITFFTIFITLSTACMLLRK